MNTPPEHPDVGLRLVILYKTVKGGAEAALALVVAFGAALGLAQWMQDAAAEAAAHMTRAWSIQLAEAVFTAATVSHLRLLAIALGFDGALTSLEGWGLQRRKKWAPWLVVVASGILLPFELLELVRHASIVRALVFLVNLAIVVYLARRIAREHEEKREAAARHVGRMET